MHSLLTTLSSMRNYKEHLFKRLQNPKAAAAYLNAALDDEDPKVFLIALKDIADARGEEINLNRERVDVENAASKLLK
jgi:DNA-binding phage protein